MTLLEIALLVGGLLAAWFVIDIASRIYLMHAPWEDYKEDQTTTDDHTYKEEQEARAVEFLSRYRVGRWLLQGYEND